MQFNAKYTNKGLVFDSPEEVNHSLFDIHNQPLIVDIRPANALSGKEKLYAFYHKVILPIVIQERTRQGWEGEDMVSADHFLKSEFAKGIRYNVIQDRQQVFLEDKHKMTKERLTKFVNDCVHFIESQYEREVPDSTSYKYPGFKSVQYGK